MSAQILMCFCPTQLCICEKSIGKVFLICFEEAKGRFRHLSQGDFEVTSESNHESVHFLGIQADQRLERICVHKT